VVALSGIARQVFCFYFKLFGKKKGCFSSHGPEVWPRIEGFSFLKNSGADYLYQVGTVQEEGGENVEAVDGLLRCLGEYSEGCIGDKLIGETFRC
jgi:hypothetical protein